MDADSCREPLAAYCYNQTYTVAKNQHAVIRTRELMAKALGYDLPQHKPDYGIRPIAEDASGQLTVEPDKPYVLLIHGSSWPDKSWPLIYWCRLARRIIAKGYQVRISWGTPAEHTKALQIAQSLTNLSTDDAVVLDKMSLDRKAQVISEAAAVVAVDTGLAHMAAAMNKPCISLYLVTSPLLTGCYGNNQIHLAVKGNETSYIKKQLAEAIVTPVKPVYLDKVPDDLLVYQYLELFIG